ncbi:MAG: L-threonylcarbamoyladenylate synthase [Myxococcota bacterium]
MDRALALVAEVLRRPDGLVIVPTESFYALGAAALSEPALARLVALKGRERGKPLPLAAASVADVLRVAFLDGPLGVLAEALWPGPLTLALQARRSLSSELLAGDGTIGVRVSADDRLRQIAEAAGGIVTATSANFAGAAPSTRIREIDKWLVRGVDLVVDGGELPGGPPSTVVGLRDGRVVVLRPGAVSVDALATLLGYAPTASTRT